MASTSSATKRETATPDDQIKFLLIIIKNLGGSIDWGAVANEANVPSKGAASMRFHRLKKSHGLSATDEGEGKVEGDGGTSKHKGKPATKKRGADGDDKQPAKKVKNEED